MAHSLSILGWADSDRSTSCLSLDTLAYSAAGIGECRCFFFMLSPPNGLYIRFGTS